MIRILGGLFTALWVYLTTESVTGLVKDSGPRLGLIAFLVCLGLSVGVPFVGDAVKAAVLRPSRSVFLVATAGAALGLAIFLQRGAMHGQVLALDSSVYVFQARALSHFELGQPLPTPFLPFSGRFLFEGPDQRLYGVFPPGYPLFLVPFVWLGQPLFAGPAAGALLALASYALGRALTRNELAVRLAVLLALGSFPRAMETADLLSHAVVGAAAAAAIACALRAPKRPIFVAAAGALVGFTFSARLLDGLVLGVFAAIPLGWFVWKKRLAPKHLALFVLAAAPFVLFVGASQRAATGSFFTPTQREYFARSDWPPTCHRLGLGKDVGCAVEHPGDRATHGEDGYDAKDALRITKERANAIGGDLFGLAVLGLLGISLPFRRRSPRYLLASGFVVAFTLAYGLFYYGNAPYFGARHLFPTAPFLYLLVARALVSFRGNAIADHGRLAGALVVATVVTMGLTQRERWLHVRTALDKWQERHINLRDQAAAEAAPRGVISSFDEYGVIAAQDFRRDLPDRLFVTDDNAGQTELRRSHPDLPMLRSFPTKVAPWPERPLPSELRFEAEASWPSFVRPDRVATKRIDTIRDVHGVRSSGGRALAVFVAEPGASLRFPIWVEAEGEYRFWLEGIVTTNSGEWDLFLDGDPVGRWSGFGAKSEGRKTEPSAPRRIARGRHEFRAVCVGKAQDSRGHLAAFDAVVLAPVSTATAPPAAPALPPPPSP